MIGRRYIDPALRIAGWALVIASAIFLVVVARNHWSAVSAIGLTPRVWLAIGGLVLVYGTGLLLTGVVWHATLMFVGAAPSGLKHSLRAHTSAQLAKYVPGNVFHFVGRHMIHRAAGGEDKRLVYAAMLENAVLLAAAMCVALLCLAMGGAFARPASIVGISLLVALIVVAAALVMMDGRLRPLLVGFLSGLCFFALMAAIVGAIAAMLGAGFAWEVGGSGVAAWIAGFVAPGSPGGMGVREAAMVLLGRDAAGPETLLTTALLFRLVTFGGDIVCAVFGRVFFRERASSRQYSI